MKVGLLTLNLRLYGVESIKRKRSIVQRILADIHRMGPAFAVCELDDQEDLQRLTLGVAHLSNDTRYTDSVLARLQRTFEHGSGYSVIEARIEII